MPLRGGPISGHLKPATENCMLDWKWIHFENLSLHLKLVTRIYQPWCEKLSHCCGFVTSRGTYVAIRKRPIRTASSLEREKDFLVWLDTIWNHFENRLSFKQRKKYTVVFLPIWRTGCFQTLSRRCWFLVTELVMNFHWTTIEAKARKVGVRRECHLKDLHVLKDSMGNNSPCHTASR